MMKICHLIIFNLDNNLNIFFSIIELNSNKPVFLFLFFTKTIFFFDNNIIKLGFERRIGYYYDFKI